MEASDLRRVALFDGLTDDQLAELLEAGTAVAVEPGDELFHEGEHADFWWVLIEGAIELRRRVGREDLTVGHLDAPGRWAGGFRAWDEHGVYLATGRCVRTGTVLRVPAAGLRRLVSHWFPLGGHLIGGVFTTARSIEATARQRDSLVTLGTLAAGLAHELNNPAAAAVRTVDSLEETCGRLMAHLAGLADHQISAGQFTALDELRREARTGTAVADPLARADQEEALGRWLERRGVEEAWLIAPVLAAAGVDLAWCERAAAAVAEPALASGLGWVASSLAASALIADVKESTRRISRLVEAAKAYSQMDRGSVQHIDLTDGIESTLVMLDHKLRAGVAVERDYGADVPRIEAYAGELNQVWTNLVDNAIDAMDGSGTVRVTTRPDGDHVVVEIADTGTGMPPEVVERAFDAFYTTKDVGKGTGLGLDIAQRIVVEHHGGTIGFDSRPGATVVRVRLPLRVPAR
jgi:signal transduction histidine kinase